MSVQNVVTGKVVGYAWSVLSYGCDSQTLRKEVLFGKEEANKMQCRVSEKEVLNKIKENKTLLDTVLKNKGDWIGRIIGGNGLPTAVLEDTFDGERRRGKK